MSTIVYQQNQASIHEPHLAETTLKLRVTAAPPPPPNADLGGWGFLQNNSQESSTMIHKDFPYTHPLSKNSKLSPQSLQLCTENLGSESGSDTFSDCSSIFSASAPSPTAARIPPPADKYSRKVNNFPPPLTTMSGASSLQVRRRSDGGRLIIDAVEGPFRNSYLHAERTDGRLKLSFSAAAACSAGEEEECGAAEAAETEEGEIEGKGNRFESELGVEMNVLERIQSFRRCNSHGSKGLCSNWKTSALWVATS
ncbi:LOW QUALITY PROTEIN: protein FANTASTIC FOUR 3-like [Salvia hispanica]|uniref:LOW QUALITY PROTEIN: protein FANTASTIC FOUR 3-like n=1 Tax=Salvia hispanica TaxID=49212 RepID=UPI002009ABDC|nr:LOW QUALITY PROTEIN: protein FANTASTIC FOUR 3-like [Salvia hispanica]